MRSLVPLTETRDLTPVDEGKEKKWRRSEKKKGKEENKKSPELQTIKEQSVTSVFYTTTHAPLYTHTHTRGVMHANTHLHTVRTGTNTKHLLSNLIKAFSRAAARAM